LYKGKGEKNETKEEISKLLQLQLNCLFNFIYNLTGKNDTVEQKKKILETALIPAHPPVLSDWFHWKFPDHSAWYLNLSLN